MVMKYYSDKNNFVVVSNQIPGHRSQHNVVNSIVNRDFSVYAFGPKAFSGHFPGRMLLVNEHFLVISRSFIQR